MIERLLVAAGLLLARPGAQSQPFTIDAMRVDIDLDAAGSMSVVETLEVTFNEPRHGIFRVIPVEYDTGRGTTRRVRLDVASVTDEAGNAYPSEVTREGHSVKIRIGDADVLLGAGTRQIYVITYSAKGMLNWFEGTSDWQPYAELYWNATGDEWDTSIERAEVNLRYPPVEAEDVRLRVFAGAYGGRDSDTVVGGQDSARGSNTGTLIRVGGEEASVVRAEPLPPFEGLTLVLNVPADAIAQPTALERFVDALRSNLGFSVFIWVLGGMLIAWWRVGRDATRGPVVVQYEPPDGLSGPEVGALVDERVNPSDLAAGVVSLAVKGYLELFPREEGRVFHHRTTDLHLSGKEPGPDLSSFERELLSKLSEAGTELTESDLREKVAPHFDALQSKLYASLVERGYYPESPQRVRLIWLVGGALAALVLAGLFTLANPFRSPVPSIVGAILAAPGVWWISRAMPRRTAAGTRAHALVLGFEEFIRRAKAPELAWQSRVDPTPALYEKLLPHAVAFGLVKEWTDAFAGVLTQAPGWYHGPTGASFNGTTFGSDMAGVSSNVAEAATTPPRSAGASGGSSGFGGGGFSGGGFGGGGGGSW